MTMSNRIFWIGGLVPLAAAMRSEERRAIELTRFARTLPIALAVLVASGTGTPNVRGCVVTISNSSNNQIVQITVDGSSMKGTASIKQGGTILCTISDNNLQNNTCVCQ